MWEFLCLHFLTYARWQRYKNKILSSMPNITLMTYYIYTIKLLKTSIQKSVCVFFLVQFPDLILIPSGFHGMFPLPPSQEPFFVLISPSQFHSHAGGFNKKKPSVQLNWMKPPLNVILEKPPKAHLFSSSNTRDSLLNRRECIESPLQI